MFTRLLILLALAATVALPFVLRPKQRLPERADDTLVIITPHNEAIRHEFGVGFQRWYRAKTGRTVMLDWRVVGGTSDIGRYLESEYVAAFRNEWTQRSGRSWSAEVQAGFTNPRLADTAPQAAKDARAAFLASNVSCGIDVFFGGGSYDLVQQANAGRIVPTQVISRHPEWFRPEVIPLSFAGEQYWDERGLWVGNVLSNYGIIYNRDSLRRLGVERVPREWRDLTDPRYAGEIALADPTKSSSIAKAFENIIQQQMQRRLAPLGAAKTGGATRDGDELESRAIREGWLEGLRLLQLIGANSRYFTDSSQKPPMDVAQGDCAVGICIDFYGRSQAEVTGLRSAGEPRMGFVTPRGGTVSSVDPIALLRGAPHRDVAEAFIEFTLSMDGQKLWNLRPGVLGGPERYALRRLPVRRDFYAQAGLKAVRSDPDADPFTDEDQLVSRPAWTGHLFREMAFIVRVMVQDVHPELVEAWRAINEAREPAKTRALAALQELSSVDYDRAGAEIKRALTSKNRVDELILARELAGKFRRQYALAKKLAMERSE